MDATEPTKLIRHLPPDQYDIDQVGQLGGLVFVFRVSPTKGGIRVEIDTEPSRWQSRIGKKMLPGRTVRRMD